MANTDKDILITPNVGEVDDPKIEFKGFDNNPITLGVKDDNSVTFTATGGQILTLDTNTTTGDSFSANDISGIPVMSAGLDGVAKLSPFGGKTAVGGSSAVARLHIHQDTFNTASPTLAFPDSSNPRYSAGFSSINVSNVGQRLDIYAGDSGNNANNLTSDSVVMSVRADKRVGINTTSPNSPLDIVTLDSGVDANQAEIGPELRSSGGEYRWRFTTNTDTSRWYWKFKVPSNTSGGTNDAIWMRSRTDKNGPEQQRFNAWGRNYDDSTEQLRTIMYLDSYRVGINLTSSFDGFAQLDVNGPTRFRENVGIMRWGPSASHMIRGYHQIDYNDSGHSLMYLLGYYNNRQQHSWRTNYVTNNTSYYRNWSTYFESNTGSTQGGRPRYQNPINSITTAQGVNTSDSKIIFADVMKQYGPIGSNYEDDGYRIVKIEITNYSRTATENTDANGVGLGTFSLNNVTRNVYVYIEKTTANSLTGAEEGHKFMYNQGLTLVNTGLGTAAGGTNGDILDSGGSQSGTFNRNINCYRPSSSETDPYPERFLIRLTNPGWDELFTGTVNAAGTYTFTNGSTVNHVPAANARVKGRWNRMGLFSTGTGANTALDVGWNDRFTCYYLPPQGTSLPYSTTVPANGAGSGERGKAMYIDTTKNASYNITSQTGYGTAYGDFSNSWQNIPAQMYVGNGNQQDAYLDSIYGGLNYLYSRIGYTDKRNYASAYIGYGEVVRGLAYNLYGGRFVNPRGFRAFCRNYRNGRMDNAYAFEADSYNGLSSSAGGLPGYTANMYSYTGYQDTRQGSRTNNMRGLNISQRIGTSIEDRVYGTTVNSCYGAVIYTRMDGGTTSTMRGLQISFNLRGLNWRTADRDSAGNIPSNVTSEHYGIYVTNEARNYFSGRVGIGTNPASGIQLDVTGEMRCPTITTNTIRFRQTGYGTNSDPYGFRFVTPSSNVSRLELHLNDDSNEEFAIYGYSCAGYSCGEWSGNKYHYFRSNGDAFHSGTLTKGSGTFRIPHPLPALTDTKDLVHSFVEGPRPDLIYRDTVALVSGAATVDIDVAVGMTPGTWELLCRDPQVFVVNNQGWTPVRATVTAAGIVTIEAQDPACTDTIDWMVIAERQDAKIREANWTDDDGRTILEPDKKRPEEDYPTYESFLAEEPENKARSFEGQEILDPEDDMPE